MGQLRDERTEGLIHARLDGEADEAQLAALERALAEDPEAVELAAELQALGSTLSALPAEQPPTSIRHQLRGSFSQRQERSSGLNLLRLIAGPQALRYAYAFSAGILVTALATQLSGAPGMGDAEIAGTMVARSAPAVIEAGAARATIEVRQQGGVHHLDIGVASPGDVLLTAEFEPAQLSMTGFTHDGGRFPSLDLASGRVSVGAGDGQRFDLMLSDRGGPATVTVTLTAPDGSEQQREVRIGGG